MIYPFKTERCPYCGCYAEPKQPALGQFRTYGRSTIFGKKYLSCKCRDCYGMFRMKSFEEFDRDRA